MADLDVSRSEKKIQEEKKKHKLDAAHIPSKIEEVGSEKAEEATVVETKKKSKEDEAETETVDAKDGEKSKMKVKAEAGSTYTEKSEKKKEKEAAGEEADDDPVDEKKKKSMEDEAELKDPPPGPRLSLLKIYAKDYEEVKAKWDELELNVDVGNPLSRLVSKYGIVTDQIMLRTEKSFKESWDSGWGPLISYRELLCKGLISRSQKTEVKQYLESAEAGKYFDVPPPLDRPQTITEGFYLIFPEKKEPGWGQKDHMFIIHRNFIKFARLIPKLGEAAVGCHNFITGSNLRFSTFKKANLFFGAWRQYYFITLEVIDESGKEITCKSRVACSTSHNEWIERKFDDNPVVLKSVYVQSFCCVK